MKAHEIAHRDGMHWGDQVADTYFRQAEADIDRHWNEIVHPMLREISYDVAVDIAAGRGRNSIKLAQRARRVICVDINQENLRYMESRFRGDKRFIVMPTDGISLNGIPTSSVDLVYSFDAMVHFDVRVVLAYLDECMRVLRPGGFAFIHYSNYTGNPGGDFRKNPHWRNYMGEGLFTHLAKNAGLSIASMQIIPWGNISNLDGVALLTKCDN
jgi:ubiquinone/menaquinone biosynthesis C-methylase UbiE